jgi:hypothetical protein
MAFSVKKETYQHESETQEAPFRLINEYQKVVRQNDMRSRCFVSIVISHKYLDIKNIDRHLQWEIISRRDCDAYVSN